MDVKRFSEKQKKRDGNEVDEASRLRRHPALVSLYIEAAIFSRTRSLMI
jgi:hypothetical protein